MEARFSRWQWCNVAVIAIILLTSIWLLAKVTSVQAQETANTSTNSEVLVDDMVVPLPEDIQNLQATSPYVIDTIDTSGNTGDFVVGPGKVELEIRPGESKTVMMMVTNRIGKTHDFTLMVEDATASKDPSLGIELLGGERGPYTLRDYITFPQQTLRLENGQRARFPVTISIPVDAEPGGRYGSVLVKTLAIARDDIDVSSVAPQSPIEARVGTLFFVTIAGETNREGKLLDFTTIPESKWFEQGPINFGILFENTGSVHLAAYAKISIINILGDEVGYLELDPWFALPNSQRLREVSWNNTNLFGRYTATLELNRGYNNVIDTMTVSFWVLPWKIVLGIFTAVFIVLFLIRTFFKNFEFKRKV